jgi:hypothetical protein
VLIKRAGGMNDQSKKRVAGEGASYVLVRMYDRNDVLTRLKESFYENKDEFEKNQYYMNIDQIVLNNVLLKIEEEVYCGNNYRILSEDEIELKARKFIEYFTCCEKKFKSLDEFCDHKYTHHPEQSRTNNRTASPLCDYRNIYSQESKLYGIINQAIYNGLPEYSSENESTAKPAIWNEIFKVRRRLKEERSRRSKKDEIFKCSRAECSYEFTSKTGLKYHLEHGHDEIKEGKKRFSCPKEKCSKKYKNANGLRYHLEHGH